MRLRNNKNRIYQVIIMFSLLCVIIGNHSMSTISYAASPMKTEVYINSSSYVKLESADLIPSSKGNTASFTVTFYNGSNSTMNLNDYWVRLNTYSGSKYTLKQLETDKTKKTVAAKAKATLTFYSEVPENVSLNNLVLKIVKFDFSVSGYEKTVGKFMFNSTYNNEIAVNGYKSTKIGDTAVNMRINKATISKTTDSNTVKLDLVMRNTGKYSLSMPNASFYLQSTSGALYKLTAANSNTSEQGITLRPSVLETINLSVVLPNTISTTGMKLIVTQTVGDAASAVDIPLGKFKIGFTTSTVSTTTQYEYVKDEYKYLVKVSSVQRLPWNTGDNLITKVSIQNTGTKAAPYPNLTAGLYVNNSSEISTKTISLTNPISLAAKETTTLYYYGTVPGDFKLSNLKLKLYETELDKKTELAELTSPTITSPKTIAVGASYLVTDNNENLIAKVDDVKIYEGENDNLYAIYLDVTNNQTRAKTTAGWSGFLEAGGNLYETKTIKTKNSINSGKKEQIIITANVPKDVDLTGATLLGGLSFNDKGIIRGDEAVDGYLNVARFALPAERTVTKLFSNILVGPYTIDIKTLTAYVESTKLDMDINTEVKRDNSYDAFNKNKLIIQIEDLSTNTVIYSAPVELDTATAKYNWKTGSNYTEFIEDPIKYYAQSMTLNIYEELNGYKKLIVSKDFRWSAFTNVADPSIGG